MLGALNIPAGSSLRLSPETTIQGRKMSFVPKRHVTCAAVAETESLYEVLQVKQDASPREIKSAYRSLAKLYHPDVVQVAAEGKEFIEINEAYARLSDPDTRAEYDTSLRLSTISGRRPVMRYRADDVRARAGFHTTRRWETDQCW